MTMTIMVQTCPSRQPKVRLKKTGKRVSGITSAAWIEISLSFHWDFIEMSLRFH